MRPISGFAPTAGLVLTPVGVPAPGDAAASDADTTFPVVGTITDADGAPPTRMVRSYGGLPVLGGDLVVHESPAGVREGVSQTLRQPVRVATTPSVGANAAESRAVAKSSATQDIAGLKPQSSRLVVDATSGTGRLAWEVITSGTQADGTPSRLATYVDATSGEVLRREEQIETVDGSGQTLYSGTVPLSITKSGSTYQLKNDGVRGNTYTTDMKNKSD